MSASPQAAATQTGKALASRSKRVVADGIDSSRCGAR
jgi:hypothetical protein